jgi:hypothetical protein
MPASQALVVSWRTSLRGRRGMGRTFIGPLNDGNMSNSGLPEASRVATLTAGAQALVDASDTANGWAIGVWGLVDPWNDWSVPPPADVPRVHRDVVSTKVTPKFAVLRSRRD